MCGIFGHVTVRGSAPSISDSQAERLRDLLAHRGPDGAGLWRRQNVLLGHRRLAVLDPSPAGHQPMLSPPDPATGLSRFALVYNGELYNDLALRQALIARGVEFTTACDTETVLHAFATWGLEALDRFEGMYALALYDSTLNLLTLARDPLGIKPLYFWKGGRSVIFASEPEPILRHPEVAVEPNLWMVSAYLTTIRTVIGNDTLFDGVFAVRPGQMIQCDLDGAAPILRTQDFWHSAPETIDGIDERDAAHEVRRQLDDAICDHLRSDVPLCALLSGGLDSSIISTIARQELLTLNTYCAGFPRPVGAEEPPDDLACAREVATALSTRHHEAHLSRELFNERWPWMVQKMGMPLSTPNEVAIHMVASKLRDDDCIVTISGEGADELFAGYEGPTTSAAQYVASGDRLRSPARFELDSSAWIPIDFKSNILVDRFWSGIGHDAPLIGAMEQLFARANDETGCYGLGAHVRFYRHLNLTGLLQRLDSATMLASVEGRTPFADVRIARLAESLPIGLRFALVEDDGDGAGGSAGRGSSATAVQTSVQTKRVLRRAYSDVLPASVIERPKASFPLPFQGWMGDQAKMLCHSRFARTLFSAPAIEAVGQRPEQVWNLAWPMINVMMWGERWWGG